MNVLWMIVASVLFALMGVCIKYAAAGFTSAEMIFYRGVIGVAFMWGFARMQGVSLRTGVPLMHAWRSVIGVVAIGAWFYAIAYLPLATATAINYMSSIWIAVFLIAGGLLAWRPGRDGARPPVHAGLMLSVIAGFGGTVLLLRPDMPANQLFAGVVAVISSIAAAFAYLQLAALSQSGEPETRTVFYFAVGCAVAGAVWIAVAGVSRWSWEAGVWLLPMGVFAALGQWFMTRAYVGVDGTGTLVIANLQYSGILFAAVLGFVLFDDRITLMGWMGIALIIASGIASTVIRVRSAPGSPAEEH